MRYPREDTVPWYKQFWPWFVITPPLVGIMLGVILVTAATHDPDGLVIGDYSKEGRGINQSIERARFATQLGLAADVEIEDGRVWVQLESNPMIPRQELELRFVHPTRDQFDQHRVLNHDPVRNRYYADIEALQSALWYVYIEPTDGAWRLRGRKAEFDSREVRLEPSA
ncbi:MAG: nitrogen fixation protein FixH [Thioalkalivibrio sp.]|nr:MAG: nitrogen fixation protein FixH [Thioalkalivibrio sp.]